MKAANDNHRLLSRAEAAAYCGYSPEQFSRHVAAGRLPGALPQMKRWDKAALDNKLNELSGLAVEADSEDEYTKWEREFDARQAERARQSPQKAGRR